MREATPYAGVASRLHAEPNNRHRFVRFNQLIAGIRFTFTNSAAFLQTLAGISVYGEPSKSILFDSWFCALTD